jgi:hypothetical protein
MNKVNMATIRFMIKELEDFARENRFDEYGWYVNQLHTKAIDIRAKAKELGVPVVIDVDEITERNFEGYHEDEESSSYYEEEYSSEYDYEEEQLSSW